jgi:hypothetical protein
VPTETLTRDERQGSPPPALNVSTEDAELLAAERRQARRVHRLKWKVAAYALGTALIAGLWVLHERQANGAFERFAHEGNPGDWNPTLPALIIGIWGLAVGIGALRVYFERPTTRAEIDRVAERLGMLAPHAERAELRTLAREHLDRVARLRFHVSAWVLGMIAGFPLNVLIEWQDNGGFKRFSGNSQPGSWDIWMVEIGGAWAAVIALMALWTYYKRPERQVRAGKGLHRPTPG